MVTSLTVGAAYFLSTNLRDAKEKPPYVFLPCLTFRKSVLHGEPTPKRVYSIEELLELKDTLTEDAPFFQYQIMNKRSPSRSATPMKVRDNSANNHHRMSIRSASPMIFYTSGEKRVGSRSVTPLIRKPGDILSEVDSLS